MPGEDAPPLPGYISYVHYVRNGLVSYIHSSITHKLLRCSTDNNVTSQLFEVPVGDGKLRLCIVYSVPGKINLPAFPTAPFHGMIYMRDFNGRHPALGDVSPSPNSSGLPLLEYIRRHHLTHWPKGGDTCSSMQALFCDHVALGLQYFLPSGPSLPQTRLRITISPKYFSNYVSYISSLQSTFDLQSPDDLYSSLVDSTHKFYTC